MLQQSLEGLLIQGLQTANMDIVRHCLRTYATIDKTRDAEALVGQVLVKPYMDEVVKPPSHAHHLQFDQVLVILLHLVRDSKASASVWES